MNPDATPTPCASRPVSTCDADVAAPSFTNLDATDPGFTDPGATTASFTDPGMADTAARCYKIGPVKLRITSQHAGVLADFDQLYHHDRIDTPWPDAPELTSAADAETAADLDHVDPHDQPINVTIRSQRHRLPWIKRYQLLGDSQSLYEKQDARGLLPHLEWTINRRITQRPSRFLQLHAASLSLAGRGIIMAARSSAGKSTLTAGLLAHGWNYFCDEMTLISLADGKLHAIPKALCLKQGSFNLAARLKLPVQHQGYYATAFKGPVAYLNPRDLRPDTVSAPAPVAMVVLPQYDPNVSVKVQDVPRAQVILELAELAFNRHRFGTDAVDLLASVVKDATCIKLTSGNLSQACRTLESLIA